MDFRIGGVNNAGRIKAIEHYRAIERRAKNKSNVNVFAGDQVSKKELQLSVDVVNSAFETEIKFEIDLNKKANDFVVKVIDKDTGKLIRQIPSKEFQKISKHIKRLLKES